MLSVALTETDRLLPMVIVAEGVIMLTEGAIVSATAATLFTLTLTDALDELLAPSKAFAVRVCVPLATEDELHEKLYGLAEQAGNLNAVYVEAYRSHTHVVARGGLDRDGPRHDCAVGGKATMGATVSPAGTPRACATAFSAFTFPYSFFFSQPPVLILSADFLRMS